MTVALMSSRLEAFAQLFTLLIVFIFVLAATYFATRFVGNYQKNKLSGSNIQYIQVIKVGGKCFAIAVTKDNVSFLCELNEDELIYNSSSDTGTINKESFKAVLEKFKKDKPEG